jgi:hypothetical protein
VVTGTDEIIFEANYFVDVWFEFGANEAQALRVPLGTLFM